MESSQQVKKFLILFILLLVVTPFLSAKTYSNCEIYGTCSKTTGSGDNITNYQNITNNYYNYTQNTTIVNNFTYTGNPFDQVLNTTSNVTFNNITSPSFITFLNSLFVPYIGAIKNIDLGVYNLTTSGQLNASSLSTERYIDFVTQSVNPSAPPSGVLRLHSFDFHGFPRFEIDSGVSSSDLVVPRDNVFIAKNTYGTTILRGQAVYVTGATGNVPNIGLAIANSTNTLPQVGVAFDNIANNAFGQVMKLGVIENIDTSAFSVGDQLWVSTNVTGNYTNVRPTYPYLVQRMGSVLVSGVGNGVLLVSVAPFLGGMESGTINTNYTFAGNVTVDTNTFFIDSVNNRVGINQTSPLQMLTLAGGNFSMGDRGGTERLRIHSDYASPFEMGISSSNYHLLLEAKGPTQNDIIFRVNGSTGANVESTATEVMRIDGETGFIGINTTSQTNLLDVNGVTTIRGKLNINYSGVSEAEPWVSIRVDSTKTALIPQAGGNVFLDFDDDNDGEGEFSARSGNVKVFTVNNSGHITTGGGFEPSVLFAGSSSASQNDWYDAFTSVVPNTGESAVLSGSSFTSGGTGALCIFTKIQRINSTALTVYYNRISGFTSALNNNVTLINGVATAVLCTNDGVNGAYSVVAI